MKYEIHFEVDLSTDGEAWSLARAIATVLGEKARETVQVRGVAEDPPLPFPPIEPGY